MLEKDIVTQRPMLFLFLDTKHAFIAKGRNTSYSYFNKTHKWDFMHLSMVFNIIPAF